MQESAIEEDALVVEDDRLRLIFTCCHPALNREAQVALTLRTLCGLTTEQIAKAFLAPLPTMAQRLVRATQKIRDAGIPYRTPPHEELAERLEAVLLVVYLVFNEGYNAAGEGRALSEEAMRLGRVLCELLPSSVPVVRQAVSNFDVFTLCTTRGCYFMPLLLPLLLLCKCTC